MFTKEQEPGFVSVNRLLDRYQVNIVEHCHSGVGKLHTMQCAMTVELLLN